MNEAPLLDAQRIGLEGRLAHDDHQDLKLWLRLLSCSMQIETVVRQRLRARFGISLARFDYLAQLYRHRDGLRMKALSQYLMVTGGNVTGLTDELEREGLVRRDPDPDDRRSLRVRLTDEGRAAFEAIAAEHEAWVVGLIGDLGTRDKDTLYQLLGRLRVHLARTIENTLPSS